MPPDWKGTNKLSLWVAIDDATVSNGCLKVVPESHGQVFPHEEHTEAIAFDNRVSANSISDEQMSVPLAAGSVLFFHDLLLHASNPNTNGKDRYCMIPTYRSVEDNDPVRVALLYRNSNSCNQMLLPPAGRMASRHSRHCHSLYQHIGVLLQRHTRGVFL